MSAEDKAPTEQKFCPDGFHLCEPAKGTHPEYGPTDYCPDCICFRLYESEADFLVRKLDGIRYRDRQAYEEALDRLAENSNRDWEVKEADEA